MKHRASQRFDREYAALPKILQRKVEKQVRLLVENIRHPSLRAKKYDETKDIWQAWMDRKYRLYFTIVGDTYMLISLKRHTD